MSFKNINKATDLVDGNYVAIGVTIGRIIPTSVDCGHSAIFISKGTEKYIFHWLFDGNIRFDDFSDAYYDSVRNNYFGCYLKYLNNLSESDMDAIIGILKDIKDHSNFAYGFVFSGGLYDETGNYFSENGLEEIGTCVTLCTNLFKTLLIGIYDYFKNDDWNKILATDPIYHLHLSQCEARHPALNVNLYDQFHKRITPEEMTRTSILKVEEMPIRKDVNDLSIPNFDKFISKLGF